MKKLAFFDTKSYDRIYFNTYKDKFQFEIEFFEEKLSYKTAKLAEGCDAVVAFVNDKLDKDTIEKLYSLGIQIAAMRCAGYNNVDFESAYNKVHIVRVPAYSPYAVAEFALGLILTLNRKLHKSFNRTREFNFNLEGLTGFDLHGKTIGVIGTGKIGQTFIDICSGFGVRLLAYDPYPIANLKAEYVTFEELCMQSDIISLHCPLTKDTHHIINQKSLSLMKKGVYIINTSRGALIESESLIEAIKNGVVGAAGLDVYEEESEFFFEDFSGTVMKDDILARLISMPNVLVTSHQAFLTEEALSNIAETTLLNLRDYFDNNPLKNEVCYNCSKNSTCKKDHKERCF